MIASSLYLRNAGPDKSIDTLFGLLGLLIWLFILWGLVQFWLKRRKAKRWPKAVGKIINKQASSEIVKYNIRGYRANFYYTITVSASSFYGDFHSTLTQEDDCNANLNTIEIDQSIIVRYDPSNPGNSVVLPEDNPNIPFKIDSLFLNRLLN